MLGLTQARGLNVSDIIRFASSYQAGATITTRCADGSRVAHIYPAIEARATRLAPALRQRGVAPGAPQGPRGLK